MTPMPFVADAEREIDFKERQHRHGRSERTPDIDKVMATIARPESLTWSRTLCWAFNTMPPTDEPKVAIYTTLDQVRRFYEEFLGGIEIVGSQPQMTDIRGSWYTYSETRATPMLNRATQQIHDIDSSTVSLYDGDQGISAEICWRRCADVRLDEAGRAQRWGQFLTALRNEDVSSLLALMSPAVQGAVRDYFDAEPPFVAIDGTAEMRSYYEKLFERAQVLEISPVRSAIGEWFVFSELRWTVKLRTGTERGHERRFLTAEHMPFDGDGLFQARFGYGTEME